MHRWLAVLVRAPLGVPRRQEHCKEKGLEQVHDGREKGTELVLQACSGLFPPGPSSLPRLSLVTAAFLTCSSI